MKGVLLRRSQLVKTAPWRWEYKTYCIYFPGTTFAASKIEVKPTDVILEVDGYEPPNHDRVTRWWDGSVSWWE